MVGDHRTVAPPEHGGVSGCRIERFQTTNQVTRNEQNHYLSTMQQKKKTGRKPNPQGTRHVRKMVAFYPHEWAKVEAVAEVPSAFMLEAALEKAANTSTK